MSEKNEIVKVDLNNAPSLLKELKDAFFHIPQGNSKFQNEKFVIAAQLTPERAYKNLGLTIMTIIEGIQAHLVQRELQLIDLEELDYKIENEQNPFEKRRLEIKRKHFIIPDISEDKFISDQFYELNTLYSHFRNFPKYTREQFEAGEKRYYLESLNRQVNNISGARESLINMAEDYEGLENFENHMASLENKNLSLAQLNEIYDKTLTHLRTKSSYNALENHENKRKLEQQDNLKNG